MRTNLFNRVCSLFAVVVLLTIAHHAAAAPEGTAVPYSRSNMKLDGQTINGTYDVRFKLWNKASGGDQIGPTLTITGLQITKGKMPTQTLDFGNHAFNGEARWIEVRARAGSNPYRPVGSRQRFRPIPYALALPGLYTVQNATSPSVVGGHHENAINEEVSGGTIGGGGQTGAANGIGEHFGTIGGGLGNTTDNFAATIGGGASNTALGSRSTVSGGDINIASGSISTVGGGTNNTASGNGSTVAGGSFNSATGGTATIGGGNSNSAAGNYATVAGGILNSADGAYSFAAGLRARALHNGAVVISDAAAAYLAGAPSFLDSSAAHQFTFRASGGYRFFTSAATTLGAKLDAGATAWSVLCDKNVKCNIVPVNPRDVLERLANVPISTWNYIDDPSATPHMGPMAQDFHHAFKLGSDDKSISTLDADGVLFAAVHGLHMLVQEKEMQLQQQQLQLEEMNRSLSETQSQVALLAQQLEEMRQQVKVDSQ